jgi:hypothetical protein
MTTRIELTLDEAAMLLDLVAKSGEATRELPERASCSRKLIDALERLVQDLEATPIFEADGQGVQQ